MATYINQFLVPENTVSGITDDDYKNTAPFINAAKAMARTSSKAVMIIDYFKNDFLYISDNFAYWCAMTSDEIKKHGYKQYVSHVPEDEQQMLTELNAAGFKLFETFPVCERMNFTISYDFHFAKGRNKRLINHKLTPLALSPDGRIWLALCTICMSARKHPGHIIVTQAGSNMRYEYSLEKHRWTKKADERLSDTERDILALSAQGYTMADIADRLCKSIDTIKGCKRTLFARLDVGNIAEALSHAMNYNLI